MRNSGHLCYAVLLLFTAVAYCQPLERPAPILERYALILQDPPLARQVMVRGETRRALTTADALERKRGLLRIQAALQAKLAALKIPVTGATQILLNAVFVGARPDQIAQLTDLPGVAGVTRLATFHPKLNKALGLINASAAWTALGGAASAGAGVKIAILDSGIDQTHPGFQDSSLKAPSGYPVSDNAADLAYTSNKIIVARSYVGSLSALSGISPFTTPDDLSAADHVGHGTATAMIAAGVSHSSPLGTISGVAPKAWLGNYKIFGSPGVNDSTSSDVVLQALEDAFSDGMNIALVSAGDLPGLWGATDSGGTCGEASGVLCDPWAAAVSSANLGGMVIVVPAGNDGAAGNSSINTPGDVDGVITVGASTNGHTVGATVSLPSGTQFQARWSDGPQPLGSFSAPLFPVSSVDPSQYGCFGFPTGSLVGKIALLSSGQCGYFTKVSNAQAAGAVAVLMFSQPTDPELFSPTGLENTGIPMAQISNASGAALKSYLTQNPGAVVTLNPATLEGAASGGSVAYFSSRGPNLGDLSIKPDLAAPGESIFTAAQSLDPNGALYSPNHYIGVDGTSFAAAFAAGAAALVLQAHPGYGRDQVKSALVNTAATTLTDIDAKGNSTAARSIAVGGGLLNVQSAVAANLTVTPATIAFGNVSSALGSATFTIVNTGSAPANISLAVQQRDADSKAALTVSPATFTLAANQSQTVKATLSGSTPAAGLYEGAINVTGGAVPLHIPYLYLVGTGQAAQEIPLQGNNFVTEQGTAVDLSFRTVDALGIPVQGLPVRFAPPASVYAATQATDSLGISEAYIYAPQTAGEASFSADLLNNAGNIVFSGRTRPTPQIASKGVVDAASFAAPAGGFAPGSYLTIFGTGISEAVATVRTPSLPLSLAGVSVSFDVPATNINVPAHFSLVSPSQIDVQIPWELSGQSSAELKVTLSGSVSKSLNQSNSALGSFQSQLVTIPLGVSSPAFFQYTDPSGKLVAAALDQNYAVISASNPAAAGSVVQFFLNGLGPVTNTPGSGQPSPAALISTQTTPAVTIGGSPAAVQFSGLAPGLVGLYQVNVVVPTNAATGYQPVVLTINSVSSSPAMLPIKSVGEDDALIGK